VLGLVRRAQRRLFYNELFAQGANLASAALLAMILLLLAGTEILSWQWLVVLPVGAAVGGLYTAWRRRPSAYRAAQLVDLRLGLADTLSTALYFRDNRTRVSTEIVELQAETAERASQGLDVRAAIPFRMPRTAYAMAALLLVAGSLFALRYAVSRTLDLKPPLARILEQNFGSQKTENARNTPPKMRPLDAQPQDSDLASADSQEQKAGDPQDGQSEQNAQDGDSQQAKAESKDGEKGAKAQDQEGQATDSQNGDSDDREGNNADSQSGQQGDSKDSKQGNSKQDANNSSENSSLMSKVKDAVQNLLSKMKPQQSQSGGQQQSGEQQNQQGKGQQNGAKQQNAKNGQQQQGQQQAEAQDGQSGEQSQNSQDAQGKGTGNSDAKQASKQPGSGIGSQDGDKSIKQAEQLAAMGKISEIIGKRAQNISGETTVEVQSTSQVLKTPYANRGAQHTQNGAEISRDEIPVALQSYVEQYFEQVRKPQPKK
jgi:hypothetical protein